MSDQLAAEAPLPTLNPNQKLLEALQMSKKLLDKTTRINVAVQPFMKKIECLEHELERSHKTLQAKVAMRENSYSEDTFLGTIRAEWLEALKAYSEALIEATRKAEED